MSSSSNVVPQVIQTLKSLQARRAGPEFDTDLLFVYDEFDESEKYHN